MTSRAGGEYMSAIALSVVRLQPLLEATGESLTSDHGMTSAGWRVASAIGDDGATVPVIASRLGRRRQTVQVAVDGLVASGLASLRANPRHRRSPTVQLTKRGRNAFWRIAQAQVSWAENAATCCSVADLEATARGLSDLATLLESSR